MSSDDQLRFIASELSGVCAVLIALIRALEEEESLKLMELLAILNEFRGDMTPEELNSGEGVMIERFLDALKDDRLTRFEYD